MNVEVETEERRQIWARALWFFLSSESGSELSFPMQALGEPHHSQDPHLTEAQRW